MKPRTAPTTIPVILPALIDEGLPSLDVSEARVRERSPVGEGPGKDHDVVAVESDTIVWITVVVAGFSTIEGVVIGAATVEKVVLGDSLGEALVVVGEEDDGEGSEPPAPILLERDSPDTETLWKFAPSNVMLPEVEEMLILSITRAPGSSNTSTNWYDEAAFLVINMANDF